MATTFKNSRETRCNSHVFKLYKMSYSFPLLVYFSCWPRLLKTVNVCMVYQLKTSREERYHSGKKTRFWVKPRFGFLSYHLLSVVSWHHPYPVLNCNFCLRLGSATKESMGKGLLCKHAGILEHNQGKGLETGRSTAGKEGHPSPGIF